MKNDIEYRPNFMHALRISAILLLFMLTLAFLALVQIKSVSMNSGNVIYFIVIFYIAGMVQVKMSDIAKKATLYAVATMVAAGLMLLSLLFPGWSLIVIGTILFGGGGGYFIWLNLIKRDPVIKADSEHLSLRNGMFKGEYFVVSWDDIRSLSTKSLAAGISDRTFLVISLKNPEEFTRNNNSKSLRKLMKMNKSMFEGELGVDVSHLDSPVQEILDTLNSLLAKVSKRQTSQ